MVADGRIAGARTAVLCILWLCACAEARRNVPKADAAVASGETKMSAAVRSGDAATPDAGSGNSAADAGRRDKPDAASVNSNAGSAAAESAADAGRRDKSDAASGGHHSADSGVNPGSTTAGSSATGGASGQSSNHTPTETKFVIRNDGDAALLLGGNCGHKWLGVSAQGQQIVIDEPCSCECGKESPDCKCGFICPSTEEVLVPGESVTHTWDGHALEIPTPNACHTKRVPEPGSELEARGCWNVYESNNNCDAVTFTYGSDREVTLSAKAPTPAPTRSRATLSNGTEAPIQVVKEHCGAPGWFELDMGKQFSLPGPCTCACDDGFKPGACPSCGACRDDEMQTLQPGESISFEWDGEFAYHYESGCSQRYAFPVGTQIVSKFCWQKPGESEPTCHGGLGVVEANVDFTAY